MKEQAILQGKKWRSCGKKKRYRDENAVREAIRRVHKKREVYLDYYYCEYCKGWHMTSKADSMLLGYADEDRVNRRR